MRKKLTERRCGAWCKGTLWTLSELNFLEGLGHPIGPFSQQTQWALSQIIEHEYELWWMSRSNNCIVMHSQSTSRISGNHLVKCQINVVAIATLFCEIMVDDGQIDRQTDNTTHTHFFHHIIIFAVLITGNLLISVLGITRLICSLPVMSRKSEDYWKPATSVEYYW